MIFMNDDVRNRENSQPFPMSKNSQRGAICSLPMILNYTKQTIIATHVQIATTAHARRIGLLKHERLEPRHALAIPARAWIPLMAIHTIGMKFPIDVLFLDKHNRVIRSCTLPPNRIAWAGGARMVLETAVGTIDQSRTQRGDVIEFRENTL